MIYNINNLIDDLKKKYYKNESEQIPEYERSFIDSTFTSQIKDTKYIEEEFKQEKPPKLNLASPVLWDELEFPNSEYQRLYRTNKHKTRTKIKMLLAESFTFKNVKPNKLAKELTLLDIYYLKVIHPSEFIFYDGSETTANKCANLMLFKRKNTILTNVVGKEIENDRSLIKYFLKVANKLDKLGNFNSLSCVLDGLRRNKLEDKDFDKIADLIDRNKNYLETRNLLDDKLERKEFYIIPVELILKDVEDSNRNKGSAIASKRFCDLIEFFVHMQTIEWDIKGKKKYEHFLFLKLYKFRNIRHIEIRKAEKKELGAIFLFL